MRTVDSILLKIVFCIALYIPVVSLGQDNCSEKELAQELVFKKKENRLSAENEKKLDSIIHVLNNCPGFSVSIISAAVTENTSYNELMWNRLTLVAEYLVAKQIDTGRIIFNPGAEGIEYEKIFFRLQPTSVSKEELPHPNLLKQKLADSSNCGMRQFPDIHFGKRSVFLGKDAKKQLDSIANTFNQLAFCKIAVIGYDNSCEECVQTSWDRVYSVKKYLEQKGIASSRMVFYYAAEDGDPLVVTLRMAAADEDGYSMANPPIPCYSYHRLTKRRCRNSHHP